MARETFLEGCPFSSPFPMADLSLSLSGEVAVRIELQCALLSCSVVGHLHVSVLQWQTHSIEVSQLYSV